MVISWSRCWQLSTTIVTGSHHTSLRDRAAGKKYQCLTPESIKLLTTGVIGMMVMYYIQSWGLWYVARYHLV